MPGKESEGTLRGEKKLSKRARKESNSRLDKEVQLAQPGTQNVSGAGY